MEDVNMELLWQSIDYQIYFLNSDKSIEKGGTDTAQITVVSRYQGSIWRLRATEQYIHVDF